MKTKLSNPVFVIILLIVAFFYDYHHLTFKRPQSVHAWRQADGASLALNYSRKGMNFIKPEVHNLTSDQGTTGNSATSEIPILYYTVALLYKVFGYHEFIYRLLNTLIFLTGLFYLFRGIRIVTKDAFWSGAITLFLFTSPVIVYYGNNFLSNTTALSVVFIAWYFMFRYIENQHPGDLNRAFLFFMIAGALKVTALLSFFGVALIFILDYFSLVKFLPGRKLFNQPRQTLIGGILVLLPIAGWIIYASWYNHFHESSYFSTTLFPLWSLKHEVIQDVLSSIRQNWLTEYYHRFNLLLLGGLFIINFIFSGRIRKFFIFMTLLIFVGAITYIILQFWTFRDHDYYTINLYILPVFILISTVLLIRSIQPGKVLSLILKASFLFLLIFNIQYASNHLDQRYKGWMNRNYQDKKSFYDISPYLREKGIPPGDTAISFSEYNHVGLYLMDLRGWSRYIDARYNRGKPYYYNKDSAGIARSVKNGAKYLILNGFDDLYKNPYIRPFTHHLKGSYRNVLIFDILNPDSNFSISEKEIEYIAFCDAEFRDSTGQDFRSPDRDFIFKNASMQSTENALSGGHSIKVVKDQPYGMTFRAKNLDQGESLQISVWRKGKDSPGVILAQAENLNDFLKEGKNLSGKEKGEWVEMTMEFFIPYEMQDKEIKIFVYNPGEHPAFFDDFSIQRYKSVLPEGLN